MRKARGGWAAIRYAPLAGKLMVLADYQRHPGGLPDNLPLLSKRRKAMASNRQSPLWNQDAIMAAGLAFAGMAILQGTLLPNTRLGAWRAVCVELLGRFVNCHVVAWWPVLLIAAGVVVWWRSAKSDSSKDATRSKVQVGGAK